MSRMSCCAVKNSSTLHDEDGQYAEGVPHEEISIESLASSTDDGTESRCRSMSKRAQNTSEGSTHGPEPDTIMALFVSIMARDKTESTHEMPSELNEVAQTPPPAVANASP